MFEKENLKIDILYAIVCTFFLSLFAQFIPAFYSTGKDFAFGFPITFFQTHINAGDIHMPNLTIAPFLANILIYYFIISLFRYFWSIYNKKSR